MPGQEDYTCSEEEMRTRSSMQIRGFGPREPDFSKSGVWLVRVDKLHFHVHNIIRGNLDSWVCSDFQTRRISSISGGFSHCLL